jgi:hypothetical protein
MKNIESRACNDVYKDKKVKLDGVAMFIIDSFIMITMNITNSFEMRFTFRSLLHVYRILTVVT